MSEVAVAPREAVLTHCHSAWGLPTYDPRCLEAMLFLHVCNVDCKFVASAYDYSPHSGNLPHLRVGEEVGGAENYPELLTKLRADNAQMDTHDKTLVSYVRQKLNLVNDYCFWMDDDNKKQFEFVWNAKLSWFVKKVPWFQLFEKRRAEVCATLRKHKILTREAAMESLKECLDLLENRLRDSWFVKDGRSILDCAVGAQLYIMKYHGLPTKYIDEELMDTYPNIYEFIGRIHEEVEKMDVSNQGEEMCSLHGKMRPKQKLRNVRGKWNCVEGFRCIGEGGKLPGRPVVTKKSKVKTDEEKDADRNSKIFLLGIFVVVVGYCYIFKPVRIEMDDGE